MSFYVHFINESDGAVVSKVRLVGVPAAGDEIRLCDERYFAVTRRIWCLDEPRSDGVQRVNLGVKPA